MCIQKSFISVLALKNYTPKKPTKNVRIVETGKSYSPTDHAAGCFSHSLYMQVLCWTESGLHSKPQISSAGQRKVRSSSLPSTSFFHSALLFSISPPFLHISLFCFPLMPFAVFFPKLLLLLWSKPEPNKTALSPLFSAVWPPNPCRLSPRPSVNVGAQTFTPPPVM